MRFSIINRNIQLAILASQQLAINLHTIVQLIIAALRSVSSRSKRAGTGFAAISPLPALCLRSDSGVSGVTNEIDITSSLNSVSLTIAANADSIRLLHLVIQRRIGHDRRSSLVVRIASQRYVHDAVATGIKRSIIVAVNSTIDGNSIFTLKVSIQLRRSRTDSTALSIGSCHISKAKHIRCNQINIVSVRV